MRSVTQSRRQPGNEAIGTCAFYSESKMSEEAAASSPSMLGMPMYLHFCIQYIEE